MRERRRERRQTLYARPLVRGVIALVMILQSLATISLAQAHFGSGDIEPGLTASSFEANCPAGPIDGGGPPKRERHNCAKCGMLCSVRDSATSFHFASNAGAQFWIFRAIALVILRVVDDDPPAGWANSWSSRAPPASA